MKVLLSVESDRLGFDFTVLDVDLVAAQHNGYVLAHTHEILVPCGHVLVGDTRRDVEHDDGALALNVVAVAQTAEFLLAGRVPHVECDRSAVGRKRQRVHLHTQRGHVLLLELSRQVSLHERRLADASVAHQHKLNLKQKLFITTFPDILINYSKWTTNY